MIWISYNISRVISSSDSAFIAVSHHVSLSLLHCSISVVMLRLTMWLSVEIAYVVMRLRVFQVRSSLLALALKSVLFVQPFWNVPVFDCKSCVTCRSHWNAVTGTGSLT